MLRFHPFHLKQPRRRFLAARTLAMITLSVAFGGGIARATDVLTYKYDNARTGSNSSEYVLTPQNVNQQSFGRLYSFPTDGYTYAQPLYKTQVNIPGQGVHNVIYVATEHDSVYAFDADGNNPPQGYLWKVSFIDPASGLTTVPYGDVSTSDLVPEIGITSTPVIDPATNTLYVLSKAKQTSINNITYIQKLHALDLGTGAEKMNGPTIIRASVPGTGAGSVNGVLSFDPKVEHQRSGLTLLNGVVYIAWAAHGDMGNYHGWVMGYQASDISRQVGVYCSTPNGWGGGIWMAGGGISADSQGNLYLAPGNGTTDPSNNNYAESVLRLSTNSGIQFADFFIPNNQDGLNAGDQDTGVGSAIVLPDQPGPYPHLVISADKSGNIYLLNRDSMSGYNPTANANVQTVFAGSSIHNSFAFFNNTLYVGADGKGIGAYPVANGMLAWNPVSQTPGQYGQGYATGNGTSPTISSSGASNGIVWALDNVANGKGPAVLNAYDASNLANELYSSNDALDSRDVAGYAVKFTNPIVADGRVFVPGLNSVTVYGLLASGGGSTPSAAPPVFSAPSGTVFNAPQSITLSDSSQGAIIYYTTDGTVPSTSSPVYSGPIAISGPTSIHAFASGGGYSPSPIASAFFTIESSSTPPAPEFTNGFTASGLQLNGGATINGNRLQLTDGGNSEARSAFYTSPVNIQRFTTEFDFQLTWAGADGFTFTIQGNDPTALGSLGGGLGYGPEPNYHISYTERSIPRSVAVKFDLFDNSGEGANTTGLFLNGATPTKPAIDLSTAGINLHSGDTYRARLVYDGSILGLTLTDLNDPTKTFSTNFTVDIPAQVGGSTAYVGFTAGTGANSAIQEILNWNFSPLPYFPHDFSSGGMILNNGASINAGNLQLTDGGLYEARSAYFQTPVNIENFAADFSFQLLNAQADGFTFVLQNADPHALGGVGGGLGYGREPSTPNGPAIGQSVALKFDLSNNAGEGGNSIGVFTAGAPPTTPSVDLTPTGINLHSGDTFAVHLTYDGSALGVTIRDVNNPALTYTGSFPVNIPQAVGSRYAYVGFTGGSGGLSATQNVLSFTYSNSGQSGAGGPQANAGGYLEYFASQLQGVTSGPALRTFEWGAFTEGVGSVLDATAVGDFVTYSLNIPTAGTYDIRVSTKAAVIRAQFQLAVDGANVGAVQDEYAPSDQFKVLDIGNIVVPQPGRHDFKFTVAGRNPAATDYKLAFDYIRLYQ